MKRNDSADQSAAWHAATWEGATREAMRRWAMLPLERIVAAQEEMQEIADEMNKPEHSMPKQE